MHGRELPLPRPGGGIQRGLGAQRVGISADKVDKQKRFSDKHEFDFPLLSDPDKKVAKAYGVQRGPSASSPTSGPRSLSAADGIIKDIIHSEINMNVHADKALAALRSLAPPAQPAN